MHNTFTAVFNNNVLTILCGSKSVASIHVKERTKHIYDQELYEEAAEALFDVFMVMRLRIAH